ncbi:MAG: EAL domain-containing protein [Clostridiaceae bacterium]|nr:EAL domain-containing protein [Clostridiaceae bacterium]
MLKNFVLYFNKNFLKNKEINDYLKNDYKIQPYSEALRIALIYGTVGALWILLSDKILTKVVNNLDAYERLSIYKGWAYVVVTMILVCLLVVKRVTLFEKAIKEIYSNYEELNSSNEELIALEEELRIQYKELEAKSNAIMVSDQRYKLAVEGADGGIWEWDAVNNLYYFSEKWIKYLGYEKNDADKRIEYWESLLHPEEREAVITKVKNYILSKNGRYENVYRMACRDGKYKWVLSKGQAIWDEEGKVIRMAGSHTDITKQKAIENELSFLAHYDLLTKLPNRLLFETKVNKLIARKGSTKTTFALVYMDIDNFKHVNDTLGHTSGDLLLKYISNILKYQVKAPDMIARLGGDEFAIIFQNVSDIRQVADKLQGLMKFLRRPWILDKQEFFVSYSIGISMYPEDGSNLSLLLKNADIAMYFVKKNTKDDYLFYFSEMEEENSRRIKMINDLRLAIDNQEFILYYQPIIDLNNAKLVGVEALIRWVHPIKGMVPPMEFIPLAEETGLIYDIDKWVLKEALMQKKRWEEQGYAHIKMSVNISGKGVTNIGLIDEFKNLLSKTKLNCKEIQLEVTETAMMKDIEASTKILKELKELGIMIALDDFGKGYSSLTYLQKLPIDIVKLDREFIISILDMGQNDVLVETIIKLTHDLNLQIVAEGIETKEQLEFLKLSKSDYGQGYLFSKPVTNKELEKMLEVNIDEQVKDA